MTAAVKTLLLAAVARIWSRGAASDRIGFALITADARSHRRSARRGRLGQPAGPGGRHAGQRPIRHVMVRELTGGAPSAASPTLANFPSGSSPPIEVKGPASAGAVRGHHRRPGGIRRASTGMSIVTSHDRAAFPRFRGSDSPCSYLASVANVALAAVRAALPPPVSPGPRGPARRQRAWHG